MTGGVWNEPGEDYFNQAMEDLGIEDHELEEAPVHRIGSVPIGEYPALDRVYERAHEIKDLTENREAKG